MKLDVDYINKKRYENGDYLFTKDDLEYPEILSDGKYLIDEKGHRIGTRGDYYTKKLIENILVNGCWDENPRPKYETDGAPAYTLSLNNVCNWTYFIKDQESPLITLRPIAIKKAVGEVLWIYQDATTDLNVLKDKYGITWWDEWDLKDKDMTPLRTIGSTYGEIINHYNQMKNILKGLKENPDGRRHIIDMWQFEDFKKPHGLKPCAYSSHYNVRHGRDGINYLDMKLIQRSSDFMVAGCINQMQYLSLMYMVARDAHLTPGNFTWDVTNSQIYSRHIEQAIEQLRRKPILENDLEPYIELNSLKNNFYDMEVNDISVKGYGRELIKKVNPQQKFDKGI